ncbi:hypothetical protein M8C21_028057, partial [Ambrosia artemisiifolia]
ASKISPSSSSNVAFKISSENNLIYHRTDSEALASSKPTNLKLIFSNEVASPVFTSQKITGKASGDDGNKSIKVILVDSNTKEMITTGPVASAKVKMVLLHEDYDGSDTREFKENIVINWKNKKNILQGGIYLDLQHGCGTVGEIKIKHDRNHITNVKFRLGAMVIDCPCVVQEAITSPFEVKDLRNLPKTLRPLSLDDNVGRLKNISNKSKGNIRKRLEHKGISTVKKFLHMHSSNPQELQKICGIKGKKWEMMVNHAKTSLKGNVCIKSTSQQSTTLQSNDYDHGIIDQFDNNYYEPKPCQDHEHFGTPMIYPSLSTKDFEMCDFDVFEPAEASQEGGMNYGSYWALVGNSLEGNGIRAKKRWMKLRIFSFSIVTFTKKVGLGCVCA